MVAKHHTADVPMNHSDESQRATSGDTGMLQNITLITEIGSSKYDHSRWGWTKHRHTLYVHIKAQNIQVKMSGEKIYIENEKNKNKKTKQYLKKCWEYFFGTILRTRFDWIFQSQLFYYAHMPSMNEFIHDK